MSIESDLRTFLLGKAALTALISNRIYAVYLPQTPTYPNVVFSLTSRNPQQVMDAAATLNRDRITFDVRSESFSTLISIDEQLRTALDSATRETDNFVAIHLSTVDTTYEFTVETFRRIIDYAIWYRP